MKHSELLIAVVPNSPAPSERGWTNRDKIIDASCTNSYVLNSGVTESNHTKFLHHVALLMRTFATQYCISFWNARAKSEGGQFWCLKNCPQN